MYSRSVIAALLFVSTSAFADDAQFISEQEIITTALGTLTISEIQELTNFEGCDNRAGLNCSEGTCAEDSQICTTRVKDGLEGTGNKCLCVLRSQNKCGSTESLSPQPPSGTNDKPNSCIFGTCDKSDEECGVQQRVDAKGKPIEGRFDCACKKKIAPAPTPPAGQTGGRAGGAQGQKPAGSTPQPTPPSQNPKPAQGQQPATDGSIIDDAAGAAQTAKKGADVIKTTRDIIRLIEGLL